MGPEPAPSMGEPRLMEVSGSASPAWTTRCRPSLPPCRPCRPPPPGVGSSGSASGVGSTVYAAGTFDAAASPLRPSPLNSTASALGQRPRCRPFPSLPRADAHHHASSTLPPPFTSCCHHHRHTPAAHDRRGGGHRNAVGGCRLLRRFLFWVDVGGREAKSRKGKRRRRGRWGGGGWQIAKERRLGARRARPSGGRRCG